MSNPQPFRSSARACALVLVLATGSQAAAELPDRDTVMRAANRARSFLESIAGDVDPVRLRADHAMKGKKFYVEYLNAWWDLHCVSDAVQREDIRRFLEPIVQRTATPSYHNLETSSDTEFKQDVISYLSACVLHEQLGFDTAEYQEHIRRTVPRTLSARHLSLRGIDNTMAIVYRLRQLGTEAPINMCELWARPGCVTREHRDLTRLDLTRPANWTQVYDLTHEIFYLTDHGRSAMRCADQGDLDYIRKIHAALIPMVMAQKNVDLLGELLMDLNYLKMTDLPEYEKGLVFSLKHQNEDGSWGDHALIARNVEAHRVSNPSYLPKVGQYLHTTHVVLNALLYPYKREASSVSISPHGPS